MNLTNSACTTLLNAYRPPTCYTLYSTKRKPQPPTIPYRLHPISYFHAPFLLSPYRSIVPRRRLPDFPALVNGSDANEWPQNNIYNFHLMDLGDASLGAFSGMVTPIMLYTHNLKAGGFDFHCWLILLQ